MNINIDSIPDMIEYLQSVHITRLSTAARLAGFKFKNGEFNKAGIIENLAYTPSKMRATVAVLGNMERGDIPAPVPHQRNPFADDIADELQPVVWNPGPVLPQAPDGLGDTVQRVLEALGALENRVSTVETVKRDSAQVSEAILKVATPMRDTISGLVESVVNLKAEIKAQKPFQLVINNVTLPIISGQHAQFKRLAFWLGLGNHALLVGPASSGKTTAAIEYARIMGLELYAQPLTMDVFGVLGFVGPQGRVDTEFSRAWINGGVFLWDELSMSAKEAIGALNAALANGFATFPGLGVIKKHPDFRMIAGDNSDTGANLKYGARELLDGASLDRFIRIDWPIDENIENGLGAAAPSWLACVRAIRAEIDRRDIQHVGATMRAVVQGSAALQTDAVRDGHITRLMILEDTCKKGALVAEWSAILNLPAVRAFLQGA